MTEIDFTFFNTKSQNLSLEDVVGEIVAYIGNGLIEKRPYRIIVTSDALAREGMGKAVTFVTAIVVHEVGHGARFFITRSVRTDIPTFRDRIYTETMRSITLAQELRSKLKDHFDEDYLLSDYFVIDADVGENGKTKALIREIVGMIRGSGFYARIKPDAEGVAAADKFVRPLTPETVLVSTT